MIKPVGTTVLSGSGNALLFRFLPVGQLQGGKDYVVETHPIIGWTVTTDLSGAGDYLIDPITPQPAEIDQVVGVLYPDGSVTVPMFGSFPTRVVFEAQLDQNRTNTLNKLAKMRSRLALG